MGAFEPNAARSAGAPKPQRLASLGLLRRTLVKARPAPARPGGILAIMLTVFVSIPCASWGQSSADARLQRGAYLVDRAIGCAHCHTPRDNQGRRLPGRELAGAMMQYKPVKPMKNWAPWAPAIAGLPPGYSEAQMATFMETGLKPDGERARPPMPPFKLDREDAVAIAAYLASMKRSGVK